MLQLSFYKKSKLQHFSKRKFELRFYSVNAALCCEIISTTRPHGLRKRPRHLQKTEPAPLEKGMQARFLCSLFAVNAAVDICGLVGAAEELGKLLLHLGDALGVLADPVGLQLRQVQLGLHGILLGLFQKL